MNSLEGVEDRGCLWAETVAWVRPRSISDERQVVLMLCVSNFVQTPHNSDLRDIRAYTIHTLKPSLYPLQTDK